jgi:hypothetical protein
MKTLLTYVWRMQSSNLFCDSDYPDMFIAVLPQDERQENVLK